jgi:pyruvate dehydrogenase E1 component
MITAYVVAPFVALGTDGFGRSDIRAALRSFFEVDRRHIAVAALQELTHTEAISADTVAQAIEKYAIDTAAEAPWLR